MNRVLIFGATSAIVEATARCFANAGDALFLVGRSQARLGSVADDLRVRGASKVDMATLDAIDMDRQGEVVSRAVEFLGGLDVALIGYGVLPDQTSAESDPAIVRETMEVNSVSTLCLMTHLTAILEAADTGTLAVISSVAADRGRASNYLYGSSKAAIDHYAQGLRCRLSGTGVRVVTIKPGLVDTPMTANFTKGALWARPELVAKKIYSGMKSGPEVIYVPWFWRWIMLAIRMIPERIFRRMPL
ncbi:MAG: SDR family oxidoreductase [Gammaproteobacteria bacterium]|nr:MAG: SDR family oxidoreductase [Gammaproteobacteria bacterium]